jgi:hypothetical protein
MSETAANNQETDETNHKDNQQGHKSCKGRVYLFVLGLSGLSRLQMMKIFNIHKI